MPQYCYSSDEDGYLNLYDPGNAFAWIEIPNDSEYAILNVTEWC